MIFENSQDSWQINLPEHITDVGMKISGGADSAIVCYMLSKYITTERPDIRVHPISAVVPEKPYQHIFADRVLRKVTDLTGMQFEHHVVKMIPTMDEPGNYHTKQDAIIEDLYAREVMQVHFTGITANPTPEIAPELFTAPHEGKWPLGRNKPYQDNYRHPLININKRGVAEHYNNQGVMDEIFPLTRSCEAFTLDFSQHCGECWFCAERLWGFGRYV